MNLKIFRFSLTAAFILVSCTPSVGVGELPATSIPSDTEKSIENPSSSPSDPSIEFEIVDAQVLAEDDDAYKEFIRPGVNIKLLLSNLDTGYLPEDQLQPKNFCGDCVGWDNAGTENGNEIVILHFYSSALTAGENTIRITANGIQKQVVINWTPSLQPTSSTNNTDPLKDFEVISAEVLRADNAKYKDVLRPGINIKLLLSNLDPGMLPEDQLKPSAFCITCMGWDNAGTENGYNVAVLHFHSSSFKTGKNTIKINAFGFQKEIVVTYDPSIHLVK